MRYAPYQTEYNEHSKLNQQQTLEYFLTRVFETEEVWGLDDGAEWIFNTLNDGSLTLPVWPYYKYADEAARGEWKHFNPQAESLEDFLSHTVNMLIEEDVMIEVMPKQRSTGCVISPHQLHSILTGMMDAGEYQFDS